jgi:hypothetical protein
MGEGCGKPKETLTGVVRKVHSPLSNSRCDENPSLFSPCGRDVRLACVVKGERGLLAQNIGAWWCQSVTVTHLHRTHKKGGDLLFLSLSLLRQGWTIFFSIPPPPPLPTRRASFAPTLFDVLTFLFDWLCSPQCTLSFFVPLPSLSLCVCLFAHRCFSSSVSSSTTTTTSSAFPRATLLLFFFLFLCVCCSLACCVCAVFSVFSTVAGSLVSSYCSLFSAVVLRRPFF